MLNLYRYRIVGILLIYMFLYERHACLSAVHLVNL